MPTRADTWGFVARPEDDADAIDLDVTVEGTSVAPVRGCSALAVDDARGFLYVTCKLLPEIFVIDIRDDTNIATGGDFVDLNYLDVESVILVETSTGSTSGPRSSLVDPVHGWLWVITDAPSSLIAFDLNTLEDDADIELVRDSAVSMLPLPRGNDRDEGVNTQADVGPGQLLLHPDGHHMFVTNFNDNSVSCYDLELGAAGTLVAETTEVGENPYAIALTADGSRGLVGNYSGEVIGTATHSTVIVLDTDPESATFMKPITWLVNL
jgi:DNA-binding beta-propeller fold protein YncE